MQIRKASRKDLRPIAEIFHGEMQRPPYRCKVSLKSALASINFYLKHYDVRVACVNNLVVGFIAVFKYRWIDSDRLWVGELHVKSSFHRKGFGKALLQDSLRRYKSKGVRHVELLANIKAPAMDFYRHMGFAKSDQNKLERAI